MDSQMNPPKSVLVVEDDRDVAFGTSMRLRSAGYETLIAHDGREGVDVAQRLHPSVILLDVRMPRMNGLAALDQLQRDQRTRDIPIVMLSASLIDQQAALDAGARFFLAKPYQAASLLTAVERAIAENHCEQES
jgi:CheY-like chemotaxis protein